MADFETSFEEEDSGAVATLLQGWTPVLDLTSYNWRGVGDPNRRIDPQPQPGEDPNRPTVVLGHRIEYTSFAETFEEDDGNPLRWGNVVFRVSIDIGAGSGTAMNLFRQIRKLVNGDTSSKLTWLPAGAKPVPLGVRGDWWVDELHMPFIGGSE